jgi:hypothetical protein
MVLEDLLLLQDLLLPLDPQDLGDPLHLLDLEVPLHPSDPQDLVDQLHL